MNVHLYSVTTVTGILQPSDALTEDGAFVFCVALVTLTPDQVTIQVNTLTDHPYTLKRDSLVANFCPDTKTDKIHQTYRFCDHMAPSLRDTSR